MNIALFASGTGSNVQAIIDAAAAGQISGKLACLFCDKAGAPVIDKAQAAGLPVLVLSPKDCNTRQAWEAGIIAFLKEHQVDLIVLAGFMRIIGKPLLQAYPNRIMNIHPSLLPQFPGAQAIEDAYQAGAEETGVTVHWVDEGIDTGEVINQRVLTVNPEWTLSELEEAIHRIEHQLYPQTVEQVIKEMKARGVNES